MKIKIYLKLFIFFFIVIFSNQTLAFETSVAEKYNDIFTNNILSQSDIKNYREAYNFQEQCKWKSANKHILKISDTLLMGHILAQRYLHPKCYTSKYLELYYWLKKYNDHPQAKRIYRLAIKRMPKGYKSPSKPIKPSGIVGDKIVSKKSTKYKTSKILSKNQTAIKQQLSHFLNFDLSAWGNLSLEVLVSSEGANHFASTPIKNLFPKL